jgi:MFS family permease
MGQRLGRRPFLMLLGVTAAVLGTFVYWLILSQTPPLAVTIVLAAVLAVVTCSEWSLATAYITERFHTSVRASGFAAGYSLAVLIPSFYAFWQSLIGHALAAKYTILPLTALGGLLIALGAWLGPETRDVDFEDDLEQAPAAAEEPRFTRDGAAAPQRARSESVVAAEAQPPR